MKEEKYSSQDYYYDKKTGFRVFTETYHLKRGYCCKSGCKHCPYNYDKNTDTFIKKNQKSKTNSTKNP